MTASLMVAVLAADALARRPAKPAESRRQAISWKAPPTSQAGSPSSPPCAGHGYRGRVVNSSWSSRPSPSTWTRHPRTRWWPGRSCRAAELDAVDVGPFGNTAEGGADAVLPRSTPCCARPGRRRHPGLAAGQRRSRRPGDDRAGRTTTVRRGGQAAGRRDGRQDARARRGRGDDVVLAWEGEDVVAVRLPQLADSLDHILADTGAPARHSRSPTWTARPSRRSYGSWRPAAPSPSGTAWRRWRRARASAASPSTTT